MKPSKGLATWAGLVAAVAQYLGAVAVYLEADDRALALGPLATATATLWKVIEGRMNQATALAAKPAPLSFTTSSGTQFRDVTLGTPTPVGGAPAENFKSAVAAVDDLTAAMQTNNAALEEQMGDPDALPDYQTETDPPPDQGDTSINGDTGERES